MMIAFDLDGTLITNEGNIEVNDLAGPLARAREAGVTVGWASDTSLGGLRAWEELLGLQGLMDFYVAENGGVVYLPGSTSPVFTIGGAEDLRKQYNQLRTTLIQWLQGQGISVLLTHASSWCKRGEKPPDDGPLVIIDDTRLVSFTCEVRQVVEGQLVIDQELTRQVGKQIMIFAAELNIGSEVEIGDRFVDAPTPGATKGRALQVLRQKTGKNIAMIGNGTNDCSCAGMDGVTLYAVADSKQALLAVAHHVMSQPCSAGAMEALQHIMWAM